MRVLRALVVVAAFAAPLSITGSAWANGGAYLEFDGGEGVGGATYFVPGDPASGSITLSIPKARRGLLDRGPFSVYLGRNDVVAEGRPVPADLIRVGTATIEHRSGSVYVLRTTFPVPSVRPGSYDVSVCNSPCAVSGFREQITGSIVIVATAREAELLAERDRLSTRVWGLRRELRRTERAADETQKELDQAQRDDAWFADQVNGLNAEIRRLEARPKTAGARSLDGWTVVALGAGLLLIGAAAGAVLARRRSRIVVPDTVEELERDAAAR